MDLSRVTVLPVVVKFFVGPVCDMVLDGFGDFISVGDIAAGFCGC